MMNKQLRTIVSLQWGLKLSYSEKLVHSAFDSNIPVFFCEAGVLEEAEMLRCRGDQSEAPTPTKAPGSERTSCLRFMGETLTNLTRRSFEGVAKSRRHVNSGDVKLQDAALDSRALEFGEGHIIVGPIRRRHLRSARASWLGDTTE
jgi:hypothetical protein